MDVIVMEDEDEDDGKDRRRRRRAGGQPRTLCIHKMKYYTIFSMPVRHFFLHSVPSIGNMIKKKHILSRGVSFHSTSFFNK